MIQSTYEYCTESNKTNLTNIRRRNWLWSSTKNSEADVTRCVFDWLLDREGNIHSKTWHKLIEGERGVHKTMLEIQLLETRRRKLDYKKKKTAASSYRSDPVGTITFKLSKSFYYVWNDYIVLLEKLIRPHFSTQYVVGA